MGWGILVPRNITVVRLNKPAGKPRRCFASSQLNLHNGANGKTDHEIQERVGRRSSLRGLAQGWPAAELALVPVERFCRKELSSKSLLARGELDPEPTRTSKSCFALSNRASSVTVHVAHAQVRNWHEAGVFRGAAPLVGSLGVSRHDLGRGCRRHSESFRSCA